MEKNYKALAIQIHDGETQHYVVKSSVTAEQILSGDDTGVVCLCLRPEYAPLLADRMNEKADGHG